MYDVDAIEAINFEQLVTVTDRLLLRQGRVPKRRPSTARIGPSLEAAKGRQATIERTVIIQRPPRAVDARVVLGSAILPILLFIAILA
jgi:hypothetical protein